MSAQVPDHTAVRTALWRALHSEIDAAPHVLKDTVGLKLVAPPDDWKSRGDMHPERMARTRASMVARSRFIEDVVEERAAQGLKQYVLLGAGLDTFAQRRSNLASKLQVFEVERPDTQSWKKQRLKALGYAMEPWLHFVPVDFEAGESWKQRLISDGFDAQAPAVVSSTGVVMYLSREAVFALLKDVASLAGGTTLAMSFIRPLELVDADERPGLEMASKNAAASGTPFLSAFAPEEVLALARDAGFRTVQHVSAGDLNARYFSGRSDGLRMSSGEEFLVASV